VWIQYSEINIWKDIKFYCDWAAVTLTASPDCHHTLIAPDPLSPARLRPAKDESDILLCRRGTLASCSICFSSFPENGLLDWSHTHPPSPWNLIITMRGMVDTYMGQAYAHWHQQQFPTAGAKLTMTTSWRSKDCRTLHLAARRVSTRSMTSLLGLHIVISFNCPTAINNDVRYLWQKGFSLSMQRYKRRWKRTYFH
jgi:hypothetical protein